MSFSSCVASLLEAARTEGFDILLYVDRQPKAIAEPEISDMVNAADYEESSLTSTDEVEVFSTKKHLIAAGIVLSNVVINDPTAFGVTKYGLAHAKAELTAMELMSGEIDAASFAEDDEDFSEQP